MGSKDKEKQSSRHKKSGTSSSSHRKQSSSSSNAKTSSSRRESSSRTARDTLLPETPYENENADEGEEEDEPEYDHPPQSGEGREEEFPDVTYIGRYTAPSATQRPSAQTRYDSRHNQPEQIPYQDPQYPPPEVTSRRAEARAYTTSSQGQQPSYAQLTGTQDTPPYYEPAYDQPSPYYPASSAQSTGTQQTPWRPGATSRSYSSTPGYDTTRTSEETTSVGQYSTESAAATGTPRYPYVARQDSSRSSYSPATVATSSDSRQGGDPRTRRWQEVQQPMPAESWDQRGNEEKTIDDEYNRIGNEDDDTGS